MVKLEDRAENYTLEDFNSLRFVNPAFNIVKNYLHASTECPLYLMGPKGCGKSFALRKALSERIMEDKTFIPLVLTYQATGSSEILDPTKLASREDWGERYSLYMSRDIQKLMNIANVIVYEDMHYRFEAVERGEENPSHLCSELKGILKKGEEGKKNHIRLRKHTSFLYTASRKERNRQRDNR